MGIIIKSDTELQKMRNAGRLTSDVLDMMEKMIQPGMATIDIDRAAEEFIRAKGGIPSFKDYRGFPNSVCISVNDEVIHGIPSMKKLKNGDIVSVDVGAILEGYHGDAARTFACGSISEEAQRLIEVTKKCFFEGMKFARKGFHLHQISKAVQDCAESNGFSVVRDFVGHGIGRELHEDPSIPNYKPPGRGARLEKGMTLAVEPMINAGDYEIEILEDDWTVVTEDGGLSAHYENTIAITDDEPEILTLY